MTGETLPPPPSVARAPGRPDAAEPVGLDRLAADLRVLGLRPDQDLLVHCSLSEIGWVDGGPATLLQAIQDVAGARRDDRGIGPDTVDLTHFRGFSQRHGRSRPGPRSNDSRLSTRSSTRRPRRPTASVSSPSTCGPAGGAPQRPSAGVLCRARPGGGAIASGHDPECHLGERSPLRWLYDDDAAILLLGVDYAVCTAFHLAEYRVRGGADVRGADLVDDDFQQIGDALEGYWRDHPGPGGPLPGRVGMAESRLVPVRTAVNFAVGWMEKHRTGCAHK